LPMSMEMAGNRISAPYLHMTHPCAQRGEADFAHLALQLKHVGLDVTYDRIELRPDQSLWERVSAQVTAGNLSGWAYFLTPRGFSNRLCLDQISAVLNRTCEIRGAGFPLFGLLHGIASETLPPGLRLRPCVHLADPGWKEKVRSLMAGRSAEEDSQFCWRIHTGFGGDSSLTTIEVTPRREGVRFWRFAVPSSCRPVRWGHGPAGGADLTPVLFSVVKGTGRLQNRDINWFGSEDRLTQHESAYVVFEGRAPEFICFGAVASSSAPPGKMEMFRPSLNRQ
jgi:hypothetical protein